MSPDDEDSVDTESTAEVTRRGTNEPAPRRSARYADAAEARIDDLKEFLARERERLSSVESRAKEERRQADQQRNRREEAERDLHVLRRVHRKLRFGSAFFPVCMASGSGLISSDPAGSVWFGCGWALVIVAGVFQVFQSAFDL